ncbi:MAG TPA: VPLPA-CTERM-specific exosortase XrtD [Steroidobacteraceae bacterium]|jgi:exosortase D (VPLPA-CTERM-specific)|nr:VPLPA-CTERM-specific exosortase XrtD [Steroidobacteraceae bacterium]
MSDSSAIPVSSSSTGSRLPYQWPAIPWLFGLLLIGLFGAIFFEGIERMVNDWFTAEEYSHCVLLPFISAYLIWQKRSELSDLCGHANHGHWSGVLLVFTGLLVNIAGKYASIFALQQYSMLIVLYGAVVCFGGWRMFRSILAPLLLLILMVPLPNFFLNTLSSQLQLVSSQLGVMFIRMTGTSVFLEGNVIDLGAYKLQVIEACSGLRYLFPLITMAAVMAYLLRTSWWKRLLLVISAAPLTIIMNSLRIGAVGLLVERWGASMAEGFLHEFQGWMVFMLSLSILFAEVIFIAWLDGTSWRKVFGFSSARSAPATPANTKTNNYWKSLRWSVIALSMMLVAVPAVYAVPKETEVIPQREFFNSFPLNMDGWQGKHGQLDQVYLDGLKLDDYFIADYQSSSGLPVNFYVAWYDSQQAGHSVHSPRSCLPGGGWNIKSIEPTQIDNVNGRAMHANRVVMEYGGQRQLVYYWFQQRGHIITSEYTVKWYLFVDALLRHRSDGALVRAVVPVPEGTSLAAADAQMIAFIRNVAPKLSPYIPD